MKIVIDGDLSRIDFELVHRWLSTDTYWAKGIPAAVQKKAIENSVCFGAYEEPGGKMVGFCRVVTDRATFGWLSDVFVPPDSRGQGISRKLVEAVLAHPELQGFRRMLLGTKNAHGLYASYGFKALEKPEIFMEIWKKDVYGTSAWTSSSAESGKH